MVYPSSFNLITPLYLLPSVDLCTPYLSLVSLKENCSPSSRNFKSSIASLIRARVIELSCVKVRESRRAMVFGGAQGRSGHKPDGHVTPHARAQHFVGRTSTECTPSKAINNRDHAFERIVMIMRFHVFSSSNVMFIGVSSLRGRESICN